MLDIEDELQKKGFSDFDDEQHGKFDEEGSPDYAWSAEILRPDVQLDPAQLLSMLGVGGQGGSAQAMGGAQNGLQGLQGAGGGAAAMLAGPLGGVLQGQAKTFIETLKKSVREVRISVSWQDGKQRQGVTASQIIVILPETVGLAGQTPGAPIPVVPPSSDPGRAQ
jgi:general secretion pathway protein I